MLSEPTLALKLPRIISVSAFGTVAMNLSLTSSGLQTSKADITLESKIYKEQWIKLAKLIVMGDFNAKVGKETAEEEEKIKGPFSIGQRNERGTKLIEFCLENNISITNTLSRQHPRRLYTWTSLDGNTRNQIDYILVQRRWITGILSVKTLPGADCDSDHKLLVAEFKLRLKTTKKAAGPIRLIQMLFH
uniref:Endonuclease/exonuclease/phosphatase domain-containing protein n=1 Tax=Arion vulgaris TaxID=1028688 RepID=A0A0B7BTK3_9EUPU